MVVSLSASRRAAAGCVELGNYTAPSPMPCCFEHSSLHSFEDLTVTLLKILQISCMCLSLSYYDHVQVWNVYSIPRVMSHSNFIS